MTQIESQNAHLPQAPLFRPFWLAINLVVIVAHFVLSKPLWLYDLKPGSVSYAGPGEGLYFMFYLLLPWLFFAVTNTALLIYDVSCCFVKKDSKSKKYALFQAMLLLSWLILAIIEQHLSQVPEGVVRMSS